MRGIHHLWFVPTILGQLRSFKASFCYATDRRLRLLFCDVRSIYSKICVQYLYLNMKIKFQEPYEVITCILNSPLSDKLSKHTSDALHCTGDITYTVQHKPINFKISRFSQPVRTCSCSGHYQMQCDLFTFRLYWPIMIY